jgi:hypothetical protein
MGLITRQGIATAVDTVYADVEVPEWRDDEGNQTVRVKSLTATERDLFEASLVAGEGKRRHANLMNIRAKLVAACLVDATGARLYTDLSAGAEELGRKNGAAMDRVFTVCQRLAGLSQEDVDNLEKNSVPGLNGSSPSISA